MAILRRSIGWILCLALGSWVGAALAEVGEVQYLTGTLSVQKPDGSVRILSQRSKIEVGDTLTTQRDSFAQINFADGSRSTMRPNTQLRIDEFKFSQDKPESDSLLFRLVKGGLRTITGLIGKRGNLDAWKLRTSTATIGIRGSSGDTLECSQGCDGTTPTSGNLPPGTYHATYEGSYFMQNEFGQQIVNPGQFGFSGPGQPPTLLPGDPGMGLNNMPFNLGMPGGGNQNCQVQ